MSIVKTFESFVEADKFHELLKRHGAVETKVIARKRPKEKFWTIVIAGVFY